jgi:hypothetical protein
MRSIRHYKSRGAVQAGSKAANHQVVKLAPRKRQKPILIFRVGSSDFNLDSTILSKRILIREYLGSGTSLWLW